MKESDYVTSSEIAAILLQASVHEHQHCKQSSQLIYSFVRALTFHIVAISTGGYHHCPPANSHAFGSPQSRLHHVHSIMYVNRNLCNVYDFTGHSIKYLKWLH